MRNIKVLQIALILVLGIVPALSAEWGGSIDQGLSYLDTGEPTLSSTTTLALGSSGVIGRRLSYGVSMASSISTDLLDPGDVIPEPWFEILNVDTAYLNWPIIREPLDPNSMTVTIGRFPISDITGMVVATPVDGFSLSMGYSRMTYDVSLGYTGLLWQSANSILMSDTDVANSGDLSEVFGSPRLIGQAKIQLPVIFQQGISLAAIFQEDMWSSESVNFAEPGDTEQGVGGPLDTQYFGIAATGPIGRTLYHSTFFYYNTGRMLSYVDEDDPDTDAEFIYEYTPISAYVAGTSIRYYMPQLFQSSAALRVIFSSGDADFTKYYEGNSEGNANQFVPISAGSFGAVFSPKLGNVGLTEIQYSLKPLESSDNWMLSTLQTVARLMVFFRPTTGPISEAGVVVGDGKNLLGTELDLSANLTPLPDLGLSATFGLFVPAGVDGAGAFSEDYLEDGKVQTSLNLQASLGF